MIQQYINKTSDDDIEFVEDTMILRRATRRQTQLFNVNLYFLFDCVCYVCSNLLLNVPFNNNKRWHEDCNKLLRKGDSL